MKRRSLFKTAICAIAFSAMDCMGLKPLSQAPEILVSKKDWIVLLEEGTQCIIEADIARQEFETVYQDGRTIYAATSSVRFEKDGEITGRFSNDKMVGLINPAGHLFSFNVGRNLMA
jgi:hypothetical protein